MTVEHWVELGALLLAVWAAWKTVPSPPVLSWERLFKVTLAALIRGELEQAGADRPDWEAAVRGRVCFHPDAGPTPERLLGLGSLEELGGAMEPGPRALAERLAALPDPESRFKAMFADDRVLEEHLLIHPDDLGEAYDPARALGVGWDAVAAWDEGLQAALARRLADVELVQIGAALPMAEALPGARVASIGAEEALLAALEGRVKAAADRLVLLVGGEAVHPVLRALHASPGLRDHVLAVVSVGGAVGGDGDAGDEEGRSRDAWLAACFQHNQLDPELNHAIAYMSVVDVDPLAPLARSWAEQRFPVREAPATGRVAIEAVDLGVVPLRALEERVVARGLWVVLGSWVAGR